MDKETEGRGQIIMAATPGVQIDELAKPYLRLDSYRYEFETIKKAWLEYAPKL